MENKSTISVKDLSALINVSTHLIYKYLKDFDLEYIAKGNKKTLPPETVRFIMEKRGFIYKSSKKPLVINVFGMKGGIGKTSLATAIAEGASRCGFRVLAIDLDMQGNLTQSFQAKKHGQPVLRDVLKGDKTLDEIILSIHSNLDLIPSSLDNSHIEPFLSSGTFNVVSYFKDTFKILDERYDLIIMDCPPSINKVTTCATCFADMNLIPINADMDSYDGVMMSVSEIKLLESKFNDFSINIKYKIVFNKYDAREKLSLYVMGEIARQEALSPHLLPVVVRTDTAFKNTKANGNYIYDIKKASAKEDCLSLVSEITGINQWISGIESNKTKNELNELATA